VFSTAKGGVQKVAQAMICGANVLWVDTLLGAHSVPLGGFTFALRRHAHDVGVLKRGIGFNQRVQNDLRTPFFEEFVWDFVAIVRLKLIDETLDCQPEFECRVCQILGTASAGENDGLIQMPDGFVMDGHFGWQRPSAQPQEPHALL
jgi:hypothetical protein